MIGTVFVVGSANTLPGIFHVGSLVPEGGQNHVTRLSDRPSAQQQRMAQRSEHGEEAVCS